MDRSPSDFQGKTLEEFIDQLGEDRAFSVLEGGRVEPEVDHEQEMIRVDSDARIKNSDQEELYYNGTSSLGKALFLPIIASHDLPYLAGKKSSEIYKHDDDEAVIEENIGIGMNYFSGISLAADLISDAMTSVPDLPAEVFPVAVGSYVAGSFLKGRGRGIQEQIDEEYRDEFMENKDYELEFF